MKNSIMVSLRHYDLSALVFMLGLSLNKLESLDLVTYANFIFPFHYLSRHNTQVNCRTSKHDFI